MRQRRSAICRGVAHGGNTRAAERARCKNRYTFAMLLEFREARLPEDLADLYRMDVEIFAEDAFDPEAWLNLESYWILVDGQIAGCTAFWHDVDFQVDLREDEQNVPQPGTLYIQSTGLLPRHRGRGIGTRIKAWQIEYAKRHGFQRVLTNCRESNARMLAINQKFGFRPIRTTPEYYGDGEATVVLELLLK